MSAAASRPAGPHAVARLIALALLAGVALFAMVAVFALPGAVGPLAPGVARTLTLVWYGLAAAALLGWWLLRARVLSGVAPAARARGAGDGPERTLQLLILGWALLEGAALFGVTLYLLGAGTAPLVGGLAIMALGIAASWPRPEWFPAAGRATPIG